MKHTLTSIQRYQKTSAAGKPYTSVVIQTNTHGSKTLSGFGNKENESWRAGDEVEFDVEQKGAYLNFSMPKGGSGASNEHSSARIEQIYQEVVATRQSVVMLVQLLKEKGVIPSSPSPIGIPYPEDQIDPNDMPF